MDKDKTEVGITGKPVPKPRTAKQQYELEKKRRMQKHLGTNVGGTQYTSGAKYYVPSTGGTNPRARTFREFIELAEAKVEAGMTPDQKRRIRTGRSDFTDRTPAFQGGHSVADYQRRGAHRERDELNKDAKSIRKGKLDQPQFQGKTGQERIAAVKKAKGMK